MEGLINEDIESNDEGWKSWDDFEITNGDRNEWEYEMYMKMMSVKYGVFMAHDTGINRLDPKFKLLFTGPRCKEINNVGEVSTIWKSGSVGVLKLQDGCSTRILAHKLNLENLPSKISEEFLILILFNSRF
ncbi:hypothetical protein Tco_0528467 [Tanacetum coccineum]